MSNKILIAGALACLSAVAVAQSDQSKEKAPAQGQATTAGDAASGQASEKRMHKPITVTAEMGREASSGKATGKTASDDWQTPAAKSSQPKITENKTRVAPADVNGDGKADASAVSGTSSDVKSPRDLATGQSSGKRQHEPVTGTKEPASKPQQK